MTIGAFNLPLFTRSLKAKPAFSLSPCPNQQMRAGNPWKAIFSFAKSSQRMSDLLSGNKFLTTSSVTAISFGSPLNAAQRKGPLPSQKAGGYMQEQSLGNQMLSGGPFLLPLPEYYYHNRKL